MITSVEPYAKFSKNSASPCIRFIFESGKQLVIPYIHSSSFEYEEGLLNCNFGNLIIQIEGAKLLPLLIDLQSFSVDFVRIGQFAEENSPRVTRLVSVNLRGIQNDLDD